MYTGYIMYTLYTVQLTRDEVCKLYMSPFCRRTPTRQCLSRTVHLQSTPLGGRGAGDRCWCHDCKQDGDHRAFWTLCPRLAARLLCCSFAGRNQRGWKPAAVLTQYTALVCIGRAELLYRELCRDSA